jgi:hypothetical protein
MNLSTRMKCLFVLFSLFTASTLFAKEVVVLVPGFFNSFTPEYFSNDIVNSFKNKGFTVYIATGLNPIGTIEDNGVRLESYMQAVEKAENRRVSFNLVAHSAGGFYSLFVANRQKFVIKNLFTVATPFKGVEFVQKWLDDSLLFRAVTDLAHLESVRQLTPAGAQQFLASVRVAPNTRIAAFGGYQEKGLDIFNARNMSVPLRVTSHFISEQYSDGIVGYGSALGLGAIKTTQNLSAQEFRHDKYFLALEHWEQVLDYRSFILLGIRNTDYIKNEQIRFYSGLADYLVTLK